MNLNDLTAYEVLEEKTLGDIKSEGCLLRHKKSGARISLISNDDEIGRASCRERVSA